MGFSQQQIPSTVACNGATVSVNVALQHLFITLTVWSGCTYLGSSESAKQAKASSCSCRQQLEHNSVAVAAAVVPSLPKML